MAPKCNDEQFLTDLVLSMAVCIDGTSFRVLLIELHDPYFASSHREVEHCHGAVLMYSITSRSSFETLPTWKENFLRLKRSTSFPMVLIATQCDAEGEKDRQVTPEEGRALAAQIGCPFLEVSSDDNNNVGDAINQVLGEVKAHHELQASLQIPPKEHRCIIS